MTIKCRLVDIKELREKGEKPKPGDMWYAPWFIPKEYVEGNESYYLSPEYFRDHYGKRDPIVVCVPGGAHWIVDSKANNMNGHGWTVTGQVPNITCNPSIGISKYHGWLKEGILSDDLEGRKY